MLVEKFKRNFCFKEALPSDPPDRWALGMFMITLLSDELLSECGHVEPLKLLFIITKVQCEEKKVWVTSVVIHFSFKARGRSERGVRE